MASARRQVREFVEEFTLADGRSVYLLAEGRLINLAAAEGHPASVMDMSFANQALAAEYMVKNAATLEKRVYDVPGGDRRRDRPAEAGLHGRRHRRAHPGAGGVPGAAGTWGRDRSAEHGRRGGRAAGPAAPAPSPDVHSIRTIEWREGAVVMIDQRRLPLEEVYVTCRTWEEVADAIRTMVIRGAPAIGVAAAMGMALAARTALVATGTIRLGFRAFAPTCDQRPIRDPAHGCQSSLGARRDGAGVEAGGPGAGRDRLRRWSAGRSDLRGRSRLVPGHRRVRSRAHHGRAPGHAHALQRGCAGHGRVRHGSGSHQVGFARNPRARLVDETRPLFQGARLTAWELLHDGIPAELITDNMAGHFISTGLITHVVVGADRIAANGDTANKIGTYTVSVLAREHGVPFFVAAPLSTVDLTLPDGAHIPIEERAAAEVTHLRHRPRGPAGVRVRNPAFDVTPARNITAIITERGVALPPYGSSLREVEARAKPGRA